MQFYSYPKLVLYALRYLSFDEHEQLHYAGAANALEGQESISSAQTVLGSMANSLDAIQIFTKAILDTNLYTKEATQKYYVL